MFSGYEEWQHKRPEIENILVPAVTFEAKPPKRMTDGRREDKRTLDNERGTPGGQQSPENCKVLLFQGCNSVTGTLDPPGTCAWIW